ncbi:MAG: outer membrane beta-barrel protein, partial [Bacteroidales bacterium]|nr:outer membrane beta-barrel protein [Bacteroidales bacterium]
FKRYINEKIEINLDAIFINKQYDYTISQSDYIIIRYTETQSILSFPLSGTYDFKYKMFYPYLRIGASLDYMIGASISPLRAFEDFIDKDDITGSDLDILKDSRNQLNFSALIGAGVKYKIKNGYVMLDLRYHYGFTNNVSNRFSNEETFGYQYVDDDFSINNFYMSLGYVYSFYKTKGAKGKYLKF